MSGGIAISVGGFTW